MTKKTTNKLLEIVTERADAIKMLVGRIDVAASENLLDMIMQAERVFITGQGRSGLIAQCLATRLAQLDFNVHIPGHATCQRIDEPDLLLAISCSGTTRTTIEYMKVSKQVNAKVAVLTAIEKSVMIKLADQAIIIRSTDDDIENNCKYNVGPKNNTIFEEAALLYADALTFALIGRKGVSRDIISQRHTNLE